MGTREILMPLPPPRWWRPDADRNGLFREYVSRFHGIERNAQSHIRNLQQQRQLVCYALHVHSLEIAVNRHMNKGDRHLVNT